MVIMGDFNHPELDWIEVKSNKPDNHKASKFLQMISDCFWTQHITEPKHYRGCQTPKILDLVFSNEEGLVEKVQTESPLEKSHHKIINFNIKGYTQKKTKSITTFTYDRGDYDLMRQEMSKIEWDQIMGGENLEETWETMKDAVKKYIAYPAKE